MAGLAAIDRLAEAQRLRARAVADMVEFHAIDGHIAEGYLTPQRQTIEGAGLSEDEANRMIRLVRFCEAHPMVAGQLANGCISIEHADALMKSAAVVNSGEFAEALPDLLGAATGVEFDLDHHRNAHLVLLCRRHHTMVHQQGWQLWRDADGRIRTTAP